MQYLQCLWSRSFLLTTDLATQMQNTPSLGELVRGSAWQIEQIHRCRIRSVPSDVQGFMGLVQIVFPSVQIKRSERAEQKPWSPAAERGLVRDPKRCEDQCVCVSVSAPCRRRRCSFSSVWVCWVSRGDRHSNQDRNWRPTSRAGKHPDHSQQTISEADSYTTSGVCVVFLVQITQNSFLFSSIMSQMKSFCLNQAE